MKKAVFVTGAAAGTGYCIAETFARNGYNVVITSRRNENSADAAARIAAQYGVEAYGYELGIRNEQQVKDIFSDLDSKGVFVETVVLNAANLGFGNDPAKGMDFWTVPVEEFQEVFETNLVWNFMIVRQAAMRMKEQHKGAVVFISSNTAHAAIPNRSAYCASKGGINAMTKAFAVDLGPYGIRVNVVLPGTIKTDRWRKMGASAIGGQMTPLGDISDFEDVANAAYYLGSDLSKNVTGTEIVVDGGMTSQLYPRLLDQLLKEKNG
ncbi:MAG: SDR family oxidoreductase [Clostridiales bacterium]|nr:SDR family oxidoreductase [Clostridiales bacterium]